MHKKTTTLILFLLLSTIGFADVKPYFHKVKALKGDGIFSLLRRYDLIDNSCNIQSFYELNAMSKQDKLIVGKQYIIPVKIYAYDGKSIRSSIKINDYDRAVQIKKYNDIIRKKKLRKQSYLDSKILWVPLHLLDCGLESIDTQKSSSSEVTSSKAKNVPPPSSEKPKSSKNLYVPLFGKNYKDVPVIDNSLKGNVYYVVSGHGGPDPGAQCTSCVNTLCEDEYAYDVSLRLARNLMQHGATVHVIIKDKNDGIRDKAHLPCDKDEVCMDNHKIPRNQKKRLAQRANAVNELYAMYKKRGVKEQSAIMVLVDSRSVEKRQDVFFYYYKHSSRSKKLAKNCHNTFKNKYEKYQKGRGYAGFIKDRGLYMLRNTLPPAVFVELANIRNKNDQKRITLKENRQALANWLFEGMTGIEI